MSKVPKRVLELIRKSKRHNEIATKCDNEIREWLCLNNVLNDTMIDQLIDTTEQGQGSAEELYQFFEDNLEYAQKEGNNKDYE